MQYHEVTVSQMCAVGQSLRMRALNTSTRVRHDAWNRRGVAPADRQRMLDDARQASGPAYEEAYREWLTHYHNCRTCQEALRWDK